jgi:surface antigen
MENQRRTANRLSETPATFPPAGGSLLLLLALTGCVSNTAPPIETTAIPAQAAESVPEPPAPGVIGVSVGQTLDENTRSIAIAAQQDAIASGTRKSWRSGTGAYGFILPGAETGACRPYTHKIFINGRPREASGEACVKDGVWRAN